MKYQTKNVLFYGILLRGLLLLTHNSRSIFFEMRSFNFILETPFDSISAAEEGVFLYKNSINPYEGDIYHGSILYLPVLSKISSFSFSTRYCVFFCLELLLALLLKKLVSLIWNVDRINSYKSEIELSNSTEVGFNISDPDKFNALGTLDIRNRFFPRNEAELSSSTSFLETLPELVFAFFYLNPISILSTYFMNTSIFKNIFFLTFLALCANKNTYRAAVTLSLLICIDFYALSLIVPFLLYNGKQNPVIIPLLIGSISFFVTLSMVLTDPFNLSFEDLLYYSQVRQLEAPDLTPNIGTWWYLFTQTFPQFKFYFMVVFSVHPFVYTMPLTLLGYTNCTLYSQDTISKPCNP
eukprot:snap_masked-scaffold_4-processed-gene-12.30-mRNA-1 protein AED:1.00 eAED:1.00 QI:0/0/0/0/1/1/4/0/352